MAIFLTQFLAATIYPTAFTLMCCTETTSNKINFRDVIVTKVIGYHFTDLLFMVFPLNIKLLRFPLWKNFLLYHSLRHYQFYLEQTIHIMLMFLIYKPPGAIVTFIADLIEALHSLLVHHRTVLLGILIKDLKAVLIF